MAEHGAADVVVGVALIRAGRVLAARRTRPEAVAGRWELPGGKVEPGESLDEAARREIREELGCVISVTGTLTGRVPIAPGQVLCVVIARVSDGEPIPREHDAIRWLGLDRLETVDWLGPDRPFLDDLAALLAVGPAS
ncbi:MAG: (deoxy)nucleoside triphosphate pyrophosphohydrolase [Nocardioidaceae bacterium]